MKHRLIFKVSTNFMNTDRYGSSYPLHRAAGSGKYTSLVKLLQKDPELVDVIDDDGATALHKAARNGEYKCCELLLRSGSDPFLCNRYKLDSLNHAQHGYKQIQKQIDMGYDSQRSRMYLKDYGDIVDLIKDYREKINNDLVKKAVQKLEKIIPNNDHEGSPIVGMPNDLYPLIFKSFKPLQLRFFLAQPIRAKKTTKFLRFFNKR